jgi:hypothetical protein
MAPFVHAHVQELEGFAGRLSELVQEYAAKQFGTELRCTELLQELIDYLADATTAEERLAIDRLLVYLTTARDGVDPQSLTVERGGRRALVRRSLHYVLTSTAEVLERVLAAKRQLLQQGSARIEQLVLTALQAKLITEAELTATVADDLWSKLLANEQLGLLARQARMSLHGEDVKLLLNDVITRIS